jgi:hypothetical protein
MSIQVALPADSEFPPALADFFEMLGRPALQARFAQLEALGLGADSDFERDLGWGVIEALPGGAGSSQGWARPGRPHRDRVDRWSQSVRSPRGMSAANCGWRHVHWA